MKMKLLFETAVGLVFVLSVAGGSRSVDAGNPALHRMLEERHRQMNEPRAYFGRANDILGFVRQFISTHGQHANTVIETALHQIEAKAGEPSRGQNSCTNFNPVQCSALLDNTPDLVALYRHLTHTLESNPRLCAPCQESVVLLQTLVCNIEWDILRDPLITLCEALTPADGDPQTCNGTISLQGSHVYCILKEATPFEFCESNDNCYPEDTRQMAPMATRTPWAVKDVVQKKYRDNLKQRNARKTPRKSSILTIAQITDIHVEPDYAIGSPSECPLYVCCIDKSKPVAGAGYSRRWGEYQCNIPEETMNFFLEKTGELNSDMVVYTGDNPPHSGYDETIESQINCSSMVVNSLKANYPGKRIYPAIGNHDTYPSHLYSGRMEETKATNEQFNMMWKDVAGLDLEAQSTWKNLSMYSVLHEPGLRILTINTNYDWYGYNQYTCLNAKDELNAQHKSFIERTLSDARTAGEKVIILGHHPTVSGIVRANRWWNDVAVEYGDVILLHLSGHTHADLFHLNIDRNTGLAASVNLVSAVVTANTFNNPSARVFELDRNNGFEVVDYANYFFRLDQQYPDRPPTFELNYRASEDYGLADLSADSWQDLSLRFLDDDELFQKWVGHLHADVTLPVCQTCGELCKAVNICAMWFPSIDEHIACVEDWIATGPPTSTLPPIDQTTDGGETGGATGVFGGAISSTAFMIVLHLL